MFDENCSERHSVGIAQIDDYNLLNLQTDLLLHRNYFTFTSFHVLLVVFLSKT